MNRGVVFDLDQTLVDTSSLESLRKERKWDEVYKMIPELKIDSKIKDIFNYLKSNDIKIIVNTMSPSSYCSRIIKNFNLEVNGTICYHDVKPNFKPHPESFLKALRDYNLDAKYTISAGDSVHDIQASNKANVMSIACLWNAKDVKNLLNSGATFHANNTTELAQIIHNFFSQ